MLNIFDDTIDATEQLKEEIAKKVLSHVSKACGALCAADVEIAVAEDRLVEAVELAKTYGFTHETLVERLNTASYIIAHVS